MTSPTDAVARPDPDRHFPRDCWIDAETGEWGLVSNLRLVRQTELPAAISDHTDLPEDARRAAIRCAGIDNGQPISLAESWRNIG